MKLNLLERIKALQVLPAQGNIVTLRIVHDLQQMLSPSEQEIAEWQIKTGTTQITWDPIADTAKDFAIGDTAKQIIAEALKALDAQEALTQEHISLYCKFVDNDNGGGASDSPAVGDK